MVTLFLEQLKLRPTLTKKKKRFGFFEIQCTFYSKQTFFQQLTNWPISNEFERGQGVEACPVETIYDSFFIKCFTK